MDELVSVPLQAVFLIVFRWCGGDRETADDGWEGHRMDGCGLCRSLAVPETRMVSCSPWNSCGV